MHYFVYFPAWRAAAYSDSPAYSCKCIWLVLMLVALTTGMLKVHQVKAAADFLIEIMPVMFIPAGVGLLDSWPALRSVWIPVVLITLLTTIIVMAVTGQVAQKIIRKEEKKNGKVSH